VDETSCQLISYIADLVYNFHLTALMMATLCNAEKRPSRDDGILASSDYGVLIECLLLRSIINGNVARDTVIPTSLLFLLPPAKARSYMRNVIDIVEPVASADWALSASTK